jgi:hypothetical protein
MKRRRGGTPAVYSAIKMGEKRSAQYWGGRSSSSSSIGGWGTVRE